MRQKSACLAADGWDKGSWDLADLKKGLGFHKTRYLETTAASVGRDSK